MGKLNNAWHKLAIPGFAEPCGRGGRRGADDAADGIRRRRNHLLAVLLPDGTALNGKEVDMWLRSQVEQLTGLNEYTIQSLCYKNTDKGGFGFWEPAVSKPGYSRFDEGDLLMFYLVAQLKLAGFTQGEIEHAVFDLLEQDGTCSTTLREKAQVTQARRSKLDDQLATLEFLDDAMEARPSDRLYAVMESALLASAARAVEEAARSERATAEDAALVQAGFERFIRELLAELRGEDTQGTPAEELAEIGRDVERLLVAEPDPSSAEARVLTRHLAQHIACDGCATVDEASSSTQCLASRALGLFLSDAANGVPVELVFGNGSFAFLAQASRA